MKFLSLIGMRLKDDEVIEVLEDFDMSVEYEFDRSHENMPDRYWASSKTHGLQLGFDEAQILETVFIYRSHIEGFTPFSHDGCDINLFGTIEEVERWAHENGLVTQKGEPKEFQGVWREWVRAEREGKCIHYEFRHDGPSMVTLFRKK
jgi:hypothetical protein